jgi:hypothetical protein
MAIASLESRIAEHQLQSSMIGSNFLFNPKNLRIILIAIMRLINLNQETEKWPIPSPYSPPARSPI